MHAPVDWAEAIAALKSTEIGNSMLKDPALADVVIRENSNLGAYGQAINGSLLLVGKHPLSVPQKACILAHELTHCHDLATARLDHIDYAKIHGIARTEISAHMNQGTTLRQLILLGNYQPAINLFINGTTVFAESINWLNRDMVKKFLLTKPQYSSAMHTHTARQSYFFEPEPPFFIQARQFQCDANWL